MLLDRLPKRAAATFFFRPADDFVLKPMRAPVVLARSARGAELTMLEWKRRTANNYQVKRPKKQAHGGGGGCVKGD